MHAKTSTPESFSGGIARQGILRIDTTQKHFLFSRETRTNPPRPFSPIHPNIEPHPIPPFNKKNPLKRSCPSVQTLLILPPPLTPPPPSPPAQPNFRTISNHQTRKIHRDVKRASPHTRPIKVHMLFLGYMKCGGGGGWNRASPYSIPFPLRLPHPPPPPLSKNKPPQPSRIFPVFQIITP